MRGDEAVRSDNGRENRRQLALPDRKVSPHAPVLAAIWAPVTSHSGFASRASQGCFRGDAEFVATRAARGSARPPLFRGFGAIGIGQER